MSSHIFLGLLILIMAIAMTAKGAYAKSTLVQQLAHCAEIVKDQDRLACYDELARKNLPYKPEYSRHQFIQPPASFLDSSLVSEPWKSEYTLTVRSFVELISHAVMENKMPVEVLGWSRGKKDYVLHIKMQTPVNLYFLPREADSKKISMSLLRDVKMDGYTLGADQFILAIAAMVPDNETK